MDQYTFDIYFVSLWLIESSEDILEKYRTKPTVNAVVSQEVTLPNIDDRNDVTVFLQMEFPEYAVICSLTWIRLKTRGANAS